MDFLQAMGGIWYSSSSIIKLILVYAHIFSAVSAVYLQIAASNEKRLNLINSKLYQGLELS